MSAPPPLPALLIDAPIRAALHEDLGRAGDITSDAILPADMIAETRLIARAAGVVAGLDVAAHAFRLIDPRLRLEMASADGHPVRAGAELAILRGPARGMLTAERVALNFLCRMSGIATATAALVDAVAASRARIVCTRKTTPGLRIFEKYAVRCGGGFNHRFGLDDAVLIKDNHIALAGGIRPALDRVRAAIGHLVKIELEVDRLDQIADGLALGVDAILLDNMTPADLAEAVRMIGGRAITEASGRITPDSAPAIAVSGVDLISVGWLTHSAPILDIGLDF